MGTTVKKKSDGYGYKYTELATVNEYLESVNTRYYQYIDRLDGEDYIYTVPIIDGKELQPRRGCRVVQATLTGKSNPAQEQGSALTYARRYSLLMAFGLACEDDDAQMLTVDKPVKSNNNKSYPNKEPAKQQPKTVTVSAEDRERVIACMIRRNPEPEQLQAVKEYYGVSDLNDLSDNAIYFYKQNIENRGGSIDE